jgi:hypothetical protein
VIVGWDSSEGIQHMTHAGTSAFLGTTLVIVTAMGVAGCSDPSTPESQSTTTAASTSAASRPECVAVADAASTLVADVGRFVSGSVAASVVRDDLDTLTSAVTDARAAISGDAGADLDTASDALAQAQHALAARPVNVVALRDSLSTALAALSDALRVCAPDSSVPESVTVPVTTSTAPAS